MARAGVSTCSQTNGGDCNRRKRGKSVTHKLQHVQKCQCDDERRTVNMCNRRFKVVAHWQLYERSRHEWSRA